MASNYKHSGKVLPIATASGDITSGAFVVQEGFYGVALGDIASGESGSMQIRGVFKLPVPSGTVKGDLLYTPGAPATEDNAITLTKTDTSNTLIGRALTARDSDGNAEVLLAPQG